MQHFGAKNAGLALRRVRVNAVNEDASEVNVSDASGWHTTLDGRIRPKGMLSPEQNEIWWIERVAGNLWLLRALERAGGVDQGTDVNALIAAEIERQMAEQALSEAQRRAREAALAAGILDGEAVVLIQDTEPGAEHRNGQTLWIDTRSGLNRPMRWDDEYDQWVVVVDEIAMRAAQAAVAAQAAADAAERRAEDAEGAAEAAQRAADEAVEAAEAALAAAAGKGRVIYGHPDQTPGEPNSLLIGPGNILYRWDGESWVEIPSDEMANLQDALDALVAQVNANLNELSDLQTELVGVQGMLDGKSTIWPLGSSPELGPDDQGDLRLVANGGVEYWTGTEWVEADPRVTEAVLGVSEALDLANTKSTTYYKATPPTTDDIEHPETQFHTNDFWVRLEDNRLHRWDGEAWVEVKDGGLAAVEAELEAALGDISDIQLDLVGIEGLLDGKSTIYVQDTAPEGVFGPDNIGDIWIDTAGGGRLYKVWDGTKWMETDDPRLAEALDKVNSRIRTFYAPQAPSSPVGDPFVVGDLWLRTPDNLLHRWDGESWVEVQDTTIPILRDDVDRIDDDVKAHDDVIRHTLPVLEDTVVTIRDVTVPELRGGVEEAQQWIADTGVALDQRLTAAREAIDLASGWIAETGSILDQKLATAFGDGAAFNLSDALDAVEGRAVGAAQALVNALPPGGRVWRQDTPPPAGTFHRWTGEPHASTSEKVVGGQVAAVNLVPDPRGTSTDQWSAAADLFVQEKDGEPAILCAENADGGTLYAYPSTTFPINPGDEIYCSVEVKTNADLSMRLVLQGYNGMDTPTPHPNVERTAADDWYKMERHETFTGAEDPNNFIRPLVYPNQTNHPVGTGFWFRRMILSKSGPIDYFDGDSPDDRTLDLWINTAEGNKPYTWDSATNQWVESRDAAILEALEAAGDALEAAGAAMIDSVVEYAVSMSETVPPTTGWSTETPNRAPGGFVWVRTVITYGSGETKTTSPALVTGNTGAPAKTITLTAESHALTSPATGGTTSPATTKVTGTAANTTISVWQYSRNGGAFSNTLPPGVTRSGNVVTITGATMTDRTISVRMSDGGTAEDTLTVAKISDGAAGGAGQDAYAVLLTNESHSFPGGATSAIAGSTTTEIMAFKGAARQNATVGTITGQVTGLTASVASNGTQAPVVTVTVTTALTTRSGVLTIPVTVDGQTFSKRFSWTLALQGTPGTPGVSIVSITPYYFRQALAANQPPRPTTRTPPEGWVSTEPEFLSGHVLYRSELVLYSNSDFAWTDVSVVSSWMLPRPHQSPNAPGFTDIMPLNSRWEQVANGIVVAVWVQTQAPQGAAWQMRALDLAVLRSTLAVIDEGVIEQLWTDVVRSRKISTDMLLVGSGDNLVPNGSLVGDITDFLTADRGWVPIVDGGIQAIQVSPGPINVNTTSEFVLTPGKYRFKIDARADVSGSRFYVQVMHGGTASNPYPISNQVIAGPLFGGFGLWQTHEGEFEVTDQWSSQVYLRLYANHDNGVQTGNQQFRNFRIHSMADASLIVDGGIAARHLNADDVWANFVRSKKITTDMLLVGSGENLVVDPRFLDDTLNAERIAASIGSWAVETDGSERVFAVAGGAARTLRFISTAGGNAERVDLVTPGSVYRIRYDHRRGMGTSSQNVRPVIYFMRNTGTLATIYPRTATVATTTTWQTDEVQWTAPDDAIGAYFGVVASGGATSTQTMIRRPHFTSMTDPSMIVDGILHATVGIGTGGKFVADDDGVTRTEMSAQGIEHWGAIGESDSPIPQRISKFGRDLQFLTPDGVKGIDENGDGSVRGMSIDDDPVIEGTPLLGTLALRSQEVNLDTQLGHFDQVPFAGNWGGMIGNTGSTYPWSSGGEKVVMEVSREQQAGRAIAVWISGKVRFQTVSALNAVRIRLRKTEVNLPTISLPPRPMTSSPLFGGGHGDQIISNPGHGAFTMNFGLYTPSRSEMARWLVTVDNIGQPNSPFRVEDMRIIFQDLGPTNEVVLDVVNRIVFDNITPPTPPDPKKTYTSRWYAETVRRWQGSSETSSGDRPGQALQGWTSGMSGAPFHSILDFSRITAHYGETGRNISAVLSGVSNADIHRVRIRTSHVAGHWGIPPRLGIQSSATATPTINQTVTATNPGQTLYHIMNSTFRNGLNSGMRYITFGPYLRSGNHYASYHGVSGGNNRRVELEITYSR